MHHIALGFGFRVASNLKQPKREQNYSEGSIEDPHPKPETPKPPTFSCNLRHGHLIKAHRTMSHNCYESGVLSDTAWGLGFSVWV